MIIGITGGVGSGKSTVLKYLKNKYNAFIIEADIVAKDIIEPGNEAYQMVLDAFTDDIKNDDGTINRKKLGNIVFNDNTKLKILNGIIHPQVKKEILSQIDNVISNNPKQIIVIEAALLIEDGYKDICGCLWYIYCDLEVRIKRLYDNRGYSRQKSLDIIRNQMSDEDFKNNTDEFIDNSRDENQTYCQIDKIIKRYLY